MCGRVIQSSGPLRYAIVDGMNVREGRLHNYPPRWNAAPSQDLLVIRRNHRTGEISLDPLRWGLIPYWCADAKGGRKPINAKCESVRDLPTFREAYRKRRCIVPLDGFFEWKAIKGQKAKQPYAIAMKDGAPFGLAGIWENWNVRPETWVTFRTGHMGNTSRLDSQVGGADALEGEFGNGRAPAFCRPPPGRGDDDRCVPRVRHLAQDRLQDFRPLQGARAGSPERPLAPAGALRQPAARAAREPDCPPQA